MKRISKLQIPFLLAGLLLVVLTYGCQDKASRPVVQTKSLTGIKATTVTCWGNVPSDPGSAVTERGACWSTKSNPTTSSSKATTTAGTGNFSVSVSGLTMGTKYYIRCYATNKSGTNYGAELTFTTLFEDYNGNTCETVTIGSQIWMTENLKVKNYRAGNAISNVTDLTSWSNLTSEAYCVYDNNSTNKTTYGSLYNWYAVNDSRNVAPTGWHVATKADWTTLINNLGGASVAGGILKEVGTTHWTDTNTGATNTSGFIALPGGYIASENNTYGFYGLGTTGQWWAADEVDSNNGYSISLSNSSAQVVTANSTKQSGFSVRCVKD